MAAGLADRPWSFDDLLDLLQGNRATAWLTSLARASKLLVVSHSLVNAFMLRTDILTATMYCAIATSVSLALVPAARAQAPATVVRETLVAIDSSDWSRVVSLAHPESLRRFHLEQVLLAHMEEDARADPAMPAEGRDVKPLYQQLYEVESAEQLEAMPAAVMLAHYLRRPHPPFIHAPALGPGERTQRMPSARIVGTVTDGDSVAYVVFVRPARFRNETDSYASDVPEQAQVMTLKPDGGTWKIMLDGGVVWGFGAAVAYSADDE